MCGLFGVAIAGSGEFPEALIPRADESLASLYHRGPDQHGVFMEDGVYLGHRRLSILDLSEAGRQPMMNEPKSVAIAVNGEIYNHLVLRKELGERQFRSTSDSEVVLHGYQQWGIETLLEKADGMYAGVIFDRRSHQVWLFRDRAGIKPLYIAEVTRKGARAIVWASELKAIRKFCPELTIDPTAVLDFATQRCVPGGKTAFKNVWQLQPGSVACLDLERGAVTTKRYWKLDPEYLNEPPSGTFHDYQEQIRNTITESVREQLMADVPVGVFLSGGMDSSIICERATRESQGISTFTIGFDVATQDESRYALEVAQQFETDHHQETLTGKLDFDPFEQMNRWYDEPFGDLSALPTHRVAELTRRDCTVALSGDGGDELFGGYNWYQQFWRYHRWSGMFKRWKSISLPFYRPPNRLWQKIANRAAMLAQFDPMNQYAAVMGNLLLAELDDLRQWLEIPADYDYFWSLRPHFHPELGRYKSLQYLDFHTFLPDDILTKVDRVSMDVSLEVRVPLLSRSLIELAFQLPESFIWLRGESKGGLKSAFRDLLPPSVLERDKQGFSVPVDAWKADLLDGQPNFVHYYLNRLQTRGLGELNS